KLAGSSPETTVLAIFWQTYREVSASFRSGVMAARRPLEASGLGSNPRGGASSD
ncbi:MAG: hypothetical protein RIR89_639, partial [Actinomycetota bacterium]